MQGEKLIFEVETYRKLSKIYCFSLGLIYCKFGVEFEHFKFILIRLVWWREKDEI